MTNPTKLGIFEQPVVIYEAFQVLKRDTCAKGLYLCSNGGCCPDGRACGITDCPLTSTTSACSEAGYTVCDIVYGGGCCPSGFACARNECIPPSGYTITSDNCSSGSRLCGAQFGYGCCRNDLDCGVSTCYPRTTSTIVATITITTTDSQSSPTTELRVVTSVYKPGTAPTATVSSTAGVVTKVSAIPSTTAVPKSSAHASGSSGLSKGITGAVIGGAILLLLIAVVVSFFVCRRLNLIVRRSKASQASQRHPGDGHFPPQSSTATPFQDNQAMYASPGPAGYYAPVPTAEAPANVHPQQVQDPRANPPYNYARPKPTPDQSSWHGRHHSGDSGFSDISSSPHGRTRSHDSAVSAIGGYENSEEHGYPKHHSVDSNVSHELDDTGRRGIFSWPSRQRFQAVRLDMKIPPFHRKEIQQGVQHDSLWERKRLASVEEGSASQILLESIPPHQPR
ncbi:hypothetical protein L228DRAFT_243888 [Xylona heveae TC161]|uniref:Mid2 domain-containing protein n=1 Tax=Xylona heveae (strain CBS 132557 / TC161) TaxID=1328760 RepID=A0A165IMA3_XYLHT|nr:hypothetical protein L228DRAFT_243888 [Xylona heveae TC161]KZF25100.1 hypothetical protein L228DRAFT_243888 [Xylona heveae TC161]